MWVFGVSIETGQIQYVFLSDCLVCRHQLILTLSEYVVDHACNLAREFNQE